jgi:hypothetical protein
MKNQYFGDINDYRKYGLLRILCGGKKGSVAICWMLSGEGNEDGSKGQKVGYLSKPEAWDHFDHKLFYALQEAVLVYGDRNVTRAEADDVLSPESFFYFKAELPRDSGKRRDYFRDFLECAVTRNCDLVFFDPDTGLKIETPPPERARQLEFLYLDELKDALEAELSVLIIQFLRFNEAKFVEDRARQIFRLLNIEEITCFIAPKVVFFLLPQGKHSRTLRERGDRVEALWHPEIRVKRYSREVARAVEAPSARRHKRT